MENTCYMAAAAKIIFAILMVRTALSEIEIEKKYCDGTRTDNTSGFDVKMKCNSAMASTRKLVKCTVLKKGTNTPVLAEAGDSKKFLNNEFLFGDKRYLLDCPTTSLPSVKPVDSVMPWYTEGTIGACDGTPYTMQASEGSRKSGNFRLKIECNPKNTEVTKCTLTDHDKNDEVMATATPSQKDPVPEMFSGRTENNYIIRFEFTCNQKDRPKLITYKEFII